MPRLEERFQETLVAEGLHVDPLEVSLAADVARLMVRFAPSGVGADVAGVIDRALEARTTLPADARERLIAIAREPRFLTGVDDEELHSFGVFFGAERASSLRAEEREELGLEQFSLRYGPESALMLLEALFQLAVVDGKMDEEEARELEASARELGVDPLVVSAFFQRYDSRFISGDKSWPLSEDVITVGRSASNDVVIPDPQVAKHHCTLKRVGEGWVVDSEGGRPVVVGGAAVSSAPLKNGDRLGVGPWTLQISDGELKAFGHRSFQALSVRELDRKIGDIVLLEDVSFTLFSGEVVALVGPSGAGKTTLINAIAGIAPADTGSVELGGDDFHRILESEPSGVGIVPQEDLVHAELSVSEALFYSGRLRLPADVGPEEVQGQVDRVLQELDIRHIADSRIGDALKRGISGGQRKRVNLGQELLTRSTRVLFLDEPTSGLDPRSSHEIAKQVRQLADGGRIVFLVTHDLSSGILQQCDHLLVMVQGGRLAYFGSPEDACRYFRVPSADLIFSRLESHTPEEWASRYRDSKDWRRYVETRSKLLANNEEPQADEVTEVAGVGKAVSSGTRLATPSSLLQLKTLTSRYLRTRLRDRVGMAVYLAQPPLLALVMWIVFSSPTVPALFMLSLSWLWFGMSSSVRELILDRVIWRREHKVGVGVTPYVFSKVIVLGAMVGLQAIVYTALTWWALGIGESPFNYDLGKLMLVSVLTTWAGMSLALAISAWLSSTEAAVATLPLMLIPQICFSSIMVPLKGMGVVAKAITWVTIERFAFEATVKSGEWLEEWVSYQYNRMPSRGALYNLGFKSSDVNDNGLSFPTLLLALGLFSVAFVGISWLLVWRRARRG